MKMIMLVKGMSILDRMGILHAVDMQQVSRIGMQQSG